MSSRSNRWHAAVVKSFIILKSHVCLFRVSENSVNIGRSITDAPEIKTNNGIRIKKYLYKKINGVDWMQTAS